VETSHIKLAKPVRNFGIAVICSCAFFLIYEFILNTVFEGTVRYFFLLMLFGYVTNIALICAIICTSLVLCKKLKNELFLNITLVLMVLMSLGMTIGTLLTGGWGQGIIGDGNGNGGMCVDLEYYNTKTIVMNALKHTIPATLFIIFYIYAFKNQKFTSCGKWTNLLFCFIAPSYIIPFIIICQWIPIDVSEKWVDVTFPRVEPTIGFSFYGSVTCVNPKLNGYNPIAFLILPLAYVIIVFVQWGYMLFKAKYLNKYFKK